MWVLALAILAIGGSASGATPLDRARELYGKTRYREALEILKSLASNDLEAVLLSGKSHFGLGDFRRAQESFETAVRLGPKRSDAFHWLGKALGRRAESASFVTAPRLASQCRQNFERAVALDPANLLALNDLLEYSLEAPGFLGGGIDKARGYADRIARLSAAEHQFALARIAEKRSEFDAAERHFRQAVELAKAEPGRYVDLAKFLVRRGRIAESETEFDKAARISPSAPSLVFGRAETYVRGKRKPAEARQLLQKYLTLELTPDDPPRADAEKLLRELSGN